MKLQMTIATIAVALLPVAAHASLASERAMQANSEQLQKSSMNEEVENTSFKQRYSGKSAAAAERARFIADHTDSQTHFTDTNDYIGVQKPAVGHASDW
ncbi:hypothetical protein [Halomonas sp. M20]|uniref:hypothetical protein n=1 Tax=Halomonas sp. M20 TaxID=2763264 RepID=UPI001D0B1FAA|nr:hypothetical protein [Halomonas sp. M20]